MSSTRVAGGLVYHFDKIDFSCSTQSRTWPADAKLEGRADRLLDIMKPESSGYGQPGFVHSID
jgi:hypothetical protein